MRLEPNQNMNWARIQMAARGFVLFDRDEVRKLKDEKSSGGSERQERDREIPDEKF